MEITINFGWWLIPLVNTIAGFVWAWQPSFQDYTPGSYFPTPPTSFFATIPAIMWALFNWLVYFISDQERDEALARYEALISGPCDDKK